MFKQMMTLCFFVSASLFSPCRAEAEENISKATDTRPAGLDVPFEGIPKIELTFTAGKTQIEWKRVSSNPGEARYTWQDHTLTLGLNMSDSREPRKILLRLEPPAGKKLSLDSYTARVRLPIAGLHAVTAPCTAPIAHTLIYYHEHKKWPDNMRVYRTEIPGGFEASANANHEAPVIQIADKKGNNKITVGWTTAERGTELKGDADGDDYVLTLSRHDDVPFTGDRLEDTLFILAKLPQIIDMSWLRAMRIYARTFDEINKRQYTPAPAWTSEPVFCTWYCYLDHIDQEGVLKIARKCKSMGFGTILIDAGWDCRPDGGYGDFQNGILGDFKAMPDRFPDLPGTIKQMHEMGLRVELWSAPFWQGKKSEAYQKKTGEWHAWTDEGEDRNLCPKHPAMRDYFRDTFARVAKTYAVDGMWLDAADGVPDKCSAKHEHIDKPMGEAFTDCLAAIRDGLRSVNPEAITELRVLHGNINTKRAFDIIQPSDAPESFELLRLAGIQLRAWTDGIVLKNDPMFWKKEADATLVGKFLATMVCNGVPALSVDFLTAPEEQCKQVAAWLAFYKQHKETLLHGIFSVFGADYGAPDTMLVGEDVAVVYLHNAATREVDLRKPVKTIILLNCTDADDLTLHITPHGKQFQVQSYLPDWTKQGEAATIDVGDSPVQYHVLQGAATILESR